MRSRPRQSVRFSQRCRRNSWCSDRSDKFPTRQISCARICTGKRLCRSREPDSIHRDSIAAGVDFWLVPSAIASSSAKDPDSGVPILQPTGKRRSSLSRARRRMRHTRPHLLLLDLNLPKVSTSRRSAGCGRAKATKPSGCLRCRGQIHRMIEAKRLTLRSPLFLYAPRNEEVLKLGEIVKRLIKNEGLL